MPALEEDVTPDLKVMEMNDKKLTIDIKPRKSKKKGRSRKDSASSQDDEEEAQYDDSAPSSAEIQVIHKHPTPKNLHGILKQRTVSESSEDLSLGALSAGIGGSIDLIESPRSEGEELSSSGGLKKRSVSFNSRIDHTSFKSSASVSSMTPALKSKRKRQRKREERMMRSKGGRSNSECGTSSSEECSSNRGGNSYSEGEEEDKGDNSPRGLSRSVSDPGAASGVSTLSPIADKSEEEVEEGGKPGVDSSTAGKGRKKKGGRSDAYEKNGSPSTIPGSNRVLDFRTSPAEGDSVKKEDGENVISEEMGGGDMVGKQPSEAKNESGVMDEREVAEVAALEPDSDPSAARNKRIVSEIRTKLAGNCESSGGGDGKKASSPGAAEDSDDDNDEDKFEDAVSSLASDTASKLVLKEGQGTAVKCDDSDHKVNGVKKKGDSGDSENKENGDKSDVDTMLSWQEGTPGGNEHRTECAFKFSNSVMFDLDVD